MTAIGITGIGLTGVVRMNWVQDDLAHVLEHAHTDETSGTWTGRACPDYSLAVGSDVDDTTLRRGGGGGGGGRGGGGGGEGGRGRGGGQGAGTA